MYIYSVRKPILFIFKLEKHKYDSSNSKRQTVPNFHTGKPNFSLFDKAMAYILLWTVGREAIDLPTCPLEGEGGDNSSIDYVGNTPSTRS